MAKSQLRLVEVTRQAYGHGTRLLGTLLDGAQRHELAIAAPRHALSEDADALVPALLLRAMRSGADVVLEPPVSARLLGALPLAQDILCSFEPRLRRATVTAPSPVARAAAGGAGTASFFSGGVDSFYTALKHRASLDALLFVHGFDIPLADVALRERVVASVRAAADRLGLPLVEVEVDLRPFLEDRTLPGRMATWGMTQGAALAAVSLALAGTFDRVLIPSGAAYGDLAPWGTHPLLDPLWSTEAVRIEHDGCEARRLQKVEAVAGSPVALDVLRVCFKNREGAYNCGRCSKCVRTMVELRAVGALDRCPTFSSPLDLRQLGGRRPEGVEWRHLDHVRMLLRETGRDPALLAAVDRLLRRRDLGRRMGSFVARRLRDAVASAERRARLRRPGGRRAPLKLW